MENKFTIKIPKVYAYIALDEHKIIAQTTRNFIQNCDYYEQLVTIDQLEKMIEDGCILIRTSNKEKISAYTEHLKIGLKPIFIDSKNYYKIKNILLQISTIVDKEK